MPTVKEEEISQVVALAQPEEKKKSALISYLEGLSGTTLEPAIGLIGEALPKSLGEYAATSLLPGMQAARLGTSLVSGGIQAQAGELQKGSLNPFAPLEQQGHTLAGVTPIVGPAAAQIGETIGRGELARAAGQMTGIFATLAIPFGKSVFKKPTAIESIAESTLKTIKPSKQVRVKVQQSLPDALGDPAFELSATKPIESLADLIGTTKKARISVGKEINSELAKGGQARIEIDGTALVDEAGKSIPRGTRIAHSTEVNRVLRGAKREIGRSLTLEEAEAIRQSLNDELGAFFRQSPQKMGESQNVPPIAFKLGLRNALAEVIETRLESLGSSLKPLRKRYSNLKALENAANERYVSEITAEYPEFFKFQSLDTLTAGSAIAAFASGEPTLALNLLKVVASRRLIDIISGKLRTPDFRIKRAFSGYGKKSIGKPLVTPTRAALAYLAGQEESLEEEK